MSYRYAPPEVAKRRHVMDAKLTDFEIITISLCGELVGINSENAWYSFVKKNYRHLFPNLCSRSHFNRTRRALLQTTELLRQKLSTTFMMPCSRFFIVDNFPSPSASLEEPTTAALSMALERTMEGARPRRKPILAIRFMSWSPWKIYHRIRGQTCLHG